jgi:hypothetical protein
MPASVNGLNQILTATLPNAIELLRSGESVVEITGNM